MPWKEMNAMSLRAEFVVLARQKGSNIRELCRRYPISSRTAYKWLGRYQQEGEAGLADRSRRPKRSPKQTSKAMEAVVVAVREETGWGGRKIARVLAKRGLERVPHPNTVTDILRRNGKLDEAACAHHDPAQRFERSLPNELWQMDFKGHFAMLTGRCHPFTVLDDHSRFCLGLRACPNETGGTVRTHLQSIFQQYGLPQAILCDNGGPWGQGYPTWDLSALAVWLIRLGIYPLHGHPAHPQTQGKDERFHRTLKVELLQGRSFADLADCQHHFDAWRDRYNLWRPHEALGLDPPVEHFQPSQRPYPQALPLVEYNSGDIVRKVSSNGDVTYHNRPFRVGRGLVGQYVLLKPTPLDGCLDVFFCQYMVRQIVIA